MPGDSGIEVSRGVGDDGDDDAFQRAGCWQHDLPAAQSFLCLDQKLGDGAALESTLAQPFAQPGLCRLVKPAQAQVAPNTLCLNPFRRFTARAVEEQHRGQAQLTREVIDDLDWSVPVVVEEAAVGTQHAKL